MDAVSSSSKETHCCFTNIFKRVLSVNLFVSEPPSSEKQYLDQEIRATRIYIFLFILCLIAALIYSGPLSNEKVYIKKKFPTIDMINDLYQKNLSSLSCPCSKAAVPYFKFLSVTPKYHSICSSEYVSPLYRSKFFNTNDTTLLALGTHYRLLSLLCNSSNRFVQNAKRVFGSHELVSVETLTRSSFDIQVQSTLSSYISRIQADYRRTLSFIVKSFSVNQLLHFFSSNWHINFTDENENYIMKTYPRRFSLSNCSCAISSNCREQLTNDINIGCFPYDGFRLSKFKNISLETLNNQLFVEVWTNISNYTNYFEICKPLECQYILSDKNNPIFMLTTILGLYGGLTYILRLIVGQSLAAYRWYIKKSTTKINTNEIS